MKFRRRTNRRWQYEEEELNNLVTGSEWWFSIMGLEEEKENQEHCVFSACGLSAHLHCFFPSLCSARTHYFGTQGQYSMLVTIV